MKFNQIFKRKNIGIREGKKKERERERGGEGEKNQ